MKIAIYGTGKWAQKLVDYINLFEGIEVSFYLESCPSKRSFHSLPVYTPEQCSWEDIDFVVISSPLFQNEMLDRIIMGEHDDNKICLLNEFIYRHLSKKKCKIPYMSGETSEGLRYIANSSDIEIIREMFFTGTTYSCYQISKFLNLAEKYCGTNGTGYFFDIGANIGTTSIYVKNLMPKVSVIGFEPGAENFKMFKSNCLINGMNDIKCENYGLSNGKAKAYFHYNMHNPGGSSVSEKESGEEVNLVTLDSYVESHDIPPKNIQYLWMDVEGYEAEVICGGCISSEQERFHCGRNFRPVRIKQKVLGRIIFL